MTTIAHGPQNFGFDRGNWNNAGQHYQPDPSIEQSGNKNSGNKKFPKWAKIAIGGVAAAAVAVGGGLAAKGESDRADRAETVATGEVVPGQVLDMYQLDLANADYAKRLDVVLPFLEQHRQESINAIKSQMPNHALFDASNLTGDKKRAQEIMTNIGADVWTATSQQNTTLGRNLLSGVYADSATTLDKVKAQVGNGKGPVIYRAQVDTVSKSFYTGTVNLLNNQKININGSETMLINVMDGEDHSVWNVYVSERTSQDGKHHTPVVLAMVEYGDPGFVDGSKVTDWQPNNS